MVGNLNIFLMKNKKPKSQKKLRKKLKYVTKQQLKVPLNMKGIQKMQLGFKVILTKQILGTEA